MSGWILFMLLGVTALWVAIGAALLFLVVVRAGAGESVRARGLEPPTALRPSGT